MPVRFCLDDEPCGIHGHTELPIRLPIPGLDPYRFPYVKYCVDDLLIQIIKRRDSITPEDVRKIFAIIKKTPELINKDEVY